MVFSCGLLSSAFAAVMAVVGVFVVDFSVVVGCCGIFSIYLFTVLVIETDVTLMQRFDSR